MYEGQAQLEFNRIVKQPRTIKLSESYQQHKHGESAPQSDENGRAEEGINAKRDGKCCSG